jgi:hypothetical protein
MWGVLWWYCNLKPRFAECASITTKLEGLRGELAVSAGSAGATVGLADAVTDADAELARAGGLEVRELGSGPLEGVVRTGLWDEVLAGTVVESSAKLESVVVRACGNLASVPWSGNRPAPKAKAKAAAKAGARTLRRAGAAAPPAGKWFWSN